MRYRTEKTIVVEGLNCSKAQANNARTSGDLIFRKYEMHRVDRKLSRVKDIALLQEFDTVRLHLLGYKKGDRK